MKRFTLLDFLTPDNNLEKETVGQIIANCKKEMISKNDFLLKEGETCRHSFFVESGLLRQYSIDEKGKEHIIQFAPENWIISDRESVYFKNSSIYFIQAIEKTNVYFIDEEFILNLSKTNPEFLEFNNQLLHNHIRQLQKRINGLLSESAEERYLEFIKIYPDIQLRVPQTMIASYLGMTPESLSRVRKDLATKNFKK
jgi:CRP-like cAMP-binding protein